MEIFIKSLVDRSCRLYLPFTNTYRTLHHRIPIVELYHQTTGNLLPEDQLPTLSKKHPNLFNLSHDRLQCTLQILKKFGITALDACNNLHLFSMNPISMDNYGEILRECRFLNITAKHIIKYHTIAKTQTIASLKRTGLISDDTVLEQVLLDCFNEWPADKKTLNNFSDKTSNLLTIRTSVLERYLQWRLSITKEEFQKYCRNYLPLRHKPMADIREALDLAEKEIKFDNTGIRRNGFIISSDPLNTKLILEKVPSLAGLDIREAIRIQPAILKNNYNALLEIQDILEGYRIPMEAQVLCLRVYCMRSDTVKERLQELSQLKEFKFLSTNPRMLSLVVHKKKFVNRLDKIQAAKKQCYSLNHLISSNKIFNNYITSFGSKACGRDIAALIKSSLMVKEAHRTQKDALKEIMKQLKRHKYWLHVALGAIDDNIQYLKTKFDDQIIYNNCQLLLYPVSDLEHHINILLKNRGSEGGNDESQSDVHYNNLKYSSLTDDQMLSLVLYEIEKKYHFSGDGIWTRLDGAKVDTPSVS